MEQQNRTLLVNLLRTSGEDMIELYGVWNGDFAEGPLSQEKILVDRILDPDFLFKQGGFYEVRIEGK